MRARIAKKQEAISKMQLTVSAKEDLKTVALGTSKINYMDPRITIAWCKRNEVCAACGGEGRGRGLHRGSAQVLLCGSAQLCALGTLS